MTPLLSTPQWIVVLLVPLPNGKTDKLPVDYRTANVGVDAHDRNHWTEYATAKSLAEKWGPQFTVGFVLTANDPFFCVDIDNAKQPDGSWSPLATSICQGLPNCTIEISQSGKGLHVWGQAASIPPHSMKRVDLGIEFYTSKRFIAIGHGQVGEMLLPCPTVASFAQHFFPAREVVATVGDGPAPEWRGPTDDAELLRRALQSRSAAGVFGGKATFADLFEMNVEVLARNYPPDRSSSEPFDRSSADMALAQHLAFWTGRDAERIDRLMRQSKLVREKWEREDYLARTIQGACQQQRDVLQDKIPERAQVPPAPPGLETMHLIEGDTFMSPAAQVELFRGCFYVMDVHKALIPGGHLVNPDRFRAIYGGKTFTMDNRNERTTRNAWEAFTESQAVRCDRVDGTCFRPLLPYGALVRDAGRVRVNTFVPVEVPRKKGDITPFLNHLAKLFPDPWDRKVVLNYLAALVQRQGHKFPWAIVIQGVEGNGKTLLSLCVAEAIGHRYVHWPKASKLAKQFNNWMVGKTFYAVEDIHTSEHIDVIEELKPMITGGHGLEIEAKGVDQVSAEICGNFLFNTNHKSGLRKTKNDRRFCVVYCAQQDVEDLARDGMSGDYLPGMYRWLKHEDGFAIVSEFLHTFEIDPAFDPSGACHRAPRTSSTDAAISASQGRVEQEILEAIGQERPGFAGGWASSLAIDKLIDNLGRSGAVAPNRRRDLMRTLGYDWHPALRDGRVDNALPPDNTKPKLYLRKDHPALALTSPAEVAKAYMAAQGFR